MQEMGEFAQLLRGFLSKGLVDRIEEKCGNTSLFYIYFNLLMAHLCVSSHSAFLKLPLPAGTCFSFEKRPRTCFSFRLEPK